MFAFVVSDLTFMTMINYIFHKNMASLKCVLTYAFSIGNPLKIISLRCVLASPILNLIPVNKEKVLLKKVSSMRQQNYFANI